MLEVGRYAELIIEKKVEFGVYLKEAEGGKPDGKGEYHVLLPKAQVPENARPGDTVRVFLYRDSDDRLIATTAEPKIVLGEAKVLLIKQITKIGAFLDWGLSKDLFLPYAQMVGKPRANDSVLVRMYTDKSGRLCASMKHIYECLSTRSPYSIGDEVTGRIYEFGHDFGTYVAVDDRYSAMIPRHESVEGYRIGDEIHARVVNVLSDGKLDISLREKAYIQMGEDAESLMALIEAYAGVLPFTEKASPEVIKRETGLSKAAFKRAVGRLYKEHRIDLTDGKIRKVEPGSE